MKYNNFYGVNKYRRPRETSLERTFHFRNKYEIISFIKKEINHNLYLEKKKRKNRKHHRNYIKKHYNLPLNSCTKCNYKTRNIERFKKHDEEKHQIQHNKEESIEEIFANMCSI